VQPAIDPRFFADARDLDVVVNGMRVARRILNAAPFERYGGVEVLPGPQVNSDDEIRDFIRRNSLTAFHPVGTCAMGPGPDAVVDAGLNVHGMKGLRVVDASIMPVIVGGNTNAPTIMIAEKAADMILERAPLSPIELPLAAGRVAA
jgi:choline dehydrogenase-like flavoprotein